MKASLRSRNGDQLISLLLGIKCSELISPKDWILHYIRNFINGSIATGLFFYTMNSNNSHISCHNFAIRKDYLL